MVVHLSDLHLLSLTLLVLRVFRANDIDSVLSPNGLATVAQPLHRRAGLHSPNLIQLSHRRRDTDIASLLLSGAQSPKTIGKGEGR